MTSVAMPPTCVFQHGHFCGVRDQHHSLLSYWHSVPPVWEMVKEVGICDLLQLTTSHWPGHVEETHTQMFFMTYNKIL